MKAANDIQLTAVVTPRARQIAARAPSEEFSYALAAASLEKTAGQSLKAHGGKPATQSNAITGAAEKAGEASPTRTASAGDKGASETKSAEALANSETSKSPAKALLGAAPVALAAAPFAQPGARAAPAQMGAAKAGDAMLARAEMDAKSKTALLKAQRPVAAPSTAQADFADILARRLEKQSVFDLRLDPPAFGRVEGRLIVEDSGKAVLSLAFENQAALDFYAGDSAALRLALSNSGLDFAKGDFVFTLRPAFEASPGESAPASTALDPQFFAGFSNGAVDIRI
jgi:hypothetical protein